MSEPTTFDFGNGPIPAHRHTNPDGSLGGWVADSAHMHPTAHIGARAHVGAMAHVGARARVATSRDCLVLAWGGYTGTAYPVVGDVIVRYGCQCHPIAWWTDAAIEVACRRHEPAHAAEYAAILRAWVAMVRATIRPALADGGAA